MPFPYLEHGTLGNFAGLPSFAGLRNRGGSGFPVSSSLCPFLSLHLYFGHSLCNLQRESRITSETSYDSKAGWAQIFEAQQRSFHEIVAKFPFLFLRGIAQSSCDVLQDGVSRRCACVKLSRGYPSHHFG